MITSAPQTTAPVAIDDLFRLVLVDGITLQADGRDVTYRTVRLRETTVGDERLALRMVERAVMVGGEYRLMVSDADFRYALTLRHIEALECDGVKLPQAMLDLSFLDRLSNHDLQLIEQRIFLIEMAAQLRYGAISQEDFNLLMGGTSKEKATPQPEGPVEGVGQALDSAQPVPALLADHSGAYSGGAGAGHGG